MINTGIYIASRASNPNHPKNWRELRDVHGYKIVCSWIDADCDDTSTDFEALWTRIENEIRSCERLILYVEQEDFPLKGALVEVGMALALGVKVFIVAKDIAIDPSNFRPIGSWLNHPLVTMVDSMDTALIGAFKL